MALFSYLKYHISLLCAHLIYNYTIYSAMAQKRSKNQIRRERAKLRKVEAANSSDKPSQPTGTSDTPAESNSTTTNGLSTTKEDATPETVAPATQSEEVLTKTAENPKKKSKYNKTKPESPVMQASTGDDVSNALMEEFATVFERFEPQSLEYKESQAISSHPRDDNLDSDASSDENSDLDSDDDANRPVSKRQLRKINRIPIAELKASTNRPLAVEWFDVDAPDPFMVVKLKTLPNAVDVPSHWQQKKDYLSSKRGVERPPFRLPKFIEDTGISEMRNHDEDSLKKLQRDRVQPKMGKLDIDYQKLHDAFFKHQTKPKMLAFGEVYYEGREKIDANRHQIEHMRPGKISRALRAAVGLPENDKSPPPWVILMNELGKPPAYANCVIPGADIEYSNLGYKLAREQDWESINMVDLVWGKMEEGEETELEEDDEEEDEEEEENGAIEVTEKAAYEDGEDEPEKVDISEYSRIKTHFTNLDTKPSDTKDTVTKESLYRVLKERSLEPTNDGFVERRLGYEIGEQNESTNEGTFKEPNQTKNKQPAFDGSDFKF